MVIVAAEPTEVRQLLISRPFIGCPADKELEPGLSKSRQISAGSDLYSLAPFWLQQGRQNQGDFQSYVSQNQQIASGDYSPEKAGVGGSTPSLATISFIDLADQPEISHL